MLIIAFFEITERLFHFQIAIQILVHPHIAPIQIKTKGIFTPNVNELAHNINNKNEDISIATVLLIFFILIYSVQATICVAKNRPIKKPYIPYRPK